MKSKNTSLKFKKPIKDQKVKKTVILCIILLIVMILLSFFDIHNEERWIKIPSF